MTAQSVCRAHGGASPQARRAARERLLGTVDEAIGTLQFQMKQADKPADRIKAASELLRRAQQTGLLDEPSVTAEEAKRLLFEKLVELRDQRIVNSGGA